METPTHSRVAGGSGEKMVKSGEGVLQKGKEETKVPKPSSKSQLTPPIKSHIATQSVKMKAPKALTTSVAQNSKLSPQPKLTFSTPPQWKLLPDRVARAYKLMKLAEELALKPYVSEAQSSTSTAIIATNTKIKARNVFLTSTTTQPSPTPTTSKTSSYNKTSTKATIHSFSKPQNKLNFDIPNFQRRIQGRSKGAKKSDVEMEQYIQGLGGVYIQDDKVTTTTTKVHKVSTKSGAATPQSMAQILFVSLSTLFLLR